MLANTSSWGTLHRQLSTPDIAKRRQGVSLGKT
nr:MAG TPA: hypothetical protein [Caudoviricetes sp.]DAZ17945.1 MAG TPA: hypothetical protein [Caudoviricetes sp.]